MESIVGSIITGGLALVGVVITVIGGNKNIQNKMQVQQAVTDTKIEELTREVRAHNNFAQRVPVIEEQINFVNHRIEELEKKG